MTLRDFVEVLAFTALTASCAWPLGIYAARVLNGERTGLEFLLGPLDRLLRRAAGPPAGRDMGWRSYATALVLFNFIGLVFVYLLQRLQGYLPGNPAGLPGVRSDLAFNTAVSFATNTNWQAYGGEAVMSPLVQMLALTVQNFLSAATGIAVLTALARAFTRRQAASIGNFWVDLVRSTVYILLPLSIILAVVLVAQGCPQTRGAPIEVPSKTLKLGAVLPEQTIPTGAVASQIAIKQLGTNGGGYYNANSAHPLEAPTPLAGFLQLVAILVIPVALCRTFGGLIGDRRQGVALLLAMTIIFLPLLGLVLWTETSPPPGFAELGVETRGAADAATGSMEGKETRFGAGFTAIWVAATTAASNGSVSGMHESLQPLGGMAALFLMMVGEVAYGGVGSGLYGMIVFAIIAVFMAGLMVGRTPEYLGKKIEAFEMKMAAIVVLLPSAAVLVGAGLALSCRDGLSSLANPGAHGLSEIVYAFTSASNNNGSAFGGLSADKPFYNILLGLAMLAGRYGVIVPVLALAGSLAAKKVAVSGPGTLPTHGPLFVFWLATVVVIVGALTFLPTLALGPIAEHMAQSGLGGR